MKKIKRYVGLDVHKDTITVAEAEGRRQENDAQSAEMLQLVAKRRAEQVRLYGRISSDLRVLECSLRKICGKEIELLVV